MKISERERKLLYLLGIFVVVISAYMAVPKFKQTKTLQDEIASKKATLETKEIEIVDLEQKKTELEDELKQKKDRIVDEVEEEIIEESEQKYYSNITYGEIIVEINKFAPVSAMDFFNIKEISFTPNEESEENVETPVLEIDQTFNDVLSIDDINNDNDENDDSVIDKIANTYSNKDNIANIIFEGTYDSLIKFVENANNNEYVVEVLTIDVKNAYLRNNELAEDTIEGTVILSFPTSPNGEYTGDIYASLEQQYNTATPNPFDPFPEFIEVDETDIIENLLISIENFSTNPYFFVSNDERNGGYVAKTQKNTDGNASMKINYDFYNRSNDNIVYAVNQNENVVIQSTPQLIEIDVFNDSANANQFGVIYRDAIGREIDVIITDLTFNGWTTKNVPLPSDAVYPVVVQRFYVKAGGSGTKQIGSILLDNMRLIKYE